MPLESSIKIVRLSHIQTLVFMTVENVHVEHALGVWQLLIFQGPIYISLCITLLDTLTFVLLFLTASNTDFDLY